MAMFVVMTSCAKMPQTCWGRYRKVAVVQLNQEYTAKNLRPTMISERARGVLRVRVLGNFSVGKTDRCAYRRALADAERIAHEANNSREMATAELLMSSGSA